MIKDMCEELNIRLEDVPGFGKQSMLRTYEFLRKKYEIQCKKMKRLKDNDPNTYYTQLIRELDIDPEEQPEWGSQEMEKCYYRLIKGKILIKDEENYYWERLSRDFGMKEDDFESLYPGCSFKSIYLKQFEDTGQTPILWKRPQSEDEPIKTYTFGPSDEKVQDAEKKESRWGNAKKGETHEKRETELPEEQYPELHKSHDEINWSERKAPETRAWETKETRYIPPEKRHLINVEQERAEAEFQEFYKELCTDSDKEQKNPKKAWLEFKPLLQQPDSTGHYDRPSRFADDGTFGNVRNAPRPIFDPHAKVDMPGLKRIANYKWFEDLEEFIWHNNEDFKFISKESLEIFCYIFKIKNTIDLWMFSQLEELRYCSLSKTHAELIYSIFMRIRDDPEFQEEARSRCLYYMKPDALELEMSMLPYKVAGFKWKTDFYKFVISNMKQLGFDTEADAIWFYKDFGIRDTVELWKFMGEYDLGRCHLSPQQADLITSVFMRIRKRANFQKYAKYKCPDYETPDQLVNERMERMRKMVFGEHTAPKTPEEMK